MKLNEIKSIDDLYFFVRNHLIRQGCQSMDYQSMDNIIMASLMCSYRGRHGTSCAVGCLISDKEYSPTLEGEVIPNEDVLEAVDNSIDLEIDEEVIGLLEELQLIHDFGTIDDWKKLHRTYKLFKNIFDE